MTVDEYSEYVVLNMGRASLANAMNITSKIGKTSEYQLVDFCNSTIACVERMISDNKLTKDKAYHILDCVYACIRRINFKGATYSESMITDRLIIDIWECFNGYKITKN